MDQRRHPKIATAGIGFDRTCCTGFDDDGGSGTGSAPPNPSAINMARLFAPRLTLEPLTAAHADELFIQLSDPQALIYIDNPPPPTVEGLRERYRRLESRRSPDGSEEWLNWAVILDGRAIGFVEATVRIGGRIALAYGLGRTYWSQGYGTEAVRAMINFLESHFPGALFEATVDERNIASRRLLERIGLEITDRSDPYNLRLEGRCGFRT